MRLGSLLPQNAKAPFDLVNRLLRKREVQQVIDTVYRYCGQKESVIFCDQIMSLGFREAFKAGISFGTSRFTRRSESGEATSGRCAMARDSCSSFSRSAPSTHPSNCSHRSREVAFSRDSACMPTRI
jgi:hypothetical protein